MGSGRMGSRVTELEVRVLQIRLINGTALERLHHVENYVGHRLEAVEIRRIFGLYDIKAAYGIKNTAPALKKFAAAVKETVTSWRKMHGQKFAGDIINDLETLHDFDALVQSMTADEFKNAVPAKAHVAPARKDLDLI